MEIPVSNENISHEDSWVKRFRFDLPAILGMASHEILGKKWKFDTKGIFDLKMDQYALERL